MANARMEIVLVVEPDRVHDGAVQHVLPVHQAHQATAACACDPILLVHQAVSRDGEEARYVSLYWHNWKVTKRTPDAIV